MARNQMTPSENELLNELAAALLDEAGTELRLPDDVDAYQMRDNDPLRRSEKWWRKFLDEKVQRGELLRVNVWGGKRNITIYRRENKKPPLG